MLGGYGTPAFGVIPALYKDLHFAPGDGQGFDFDLATANQLLDQAGYRDTNGDKVREMPNGGRPLRFRVTLDGKAPGATEASIPASSKP